jgi:low affinity Fe/Cu permease
MSNDIQCIFSPAEIDIIRELANTETLNIETQLDYLIRNNQETNRNNVAKHCQNLIKLGKILAKVE